MCVKCIDIKNFANIDTPFVLSTMDVPTPFESESLSVSFEPWPRQLIVVLLLWFLFNFFSLQFTFFFKGYVFKCSD